jgi:hypothetical protein
VCVIEPITCAVNADCESPFQPRCDTATHRCVGCLGPADCADRTDGRTVCDPRGSCVPPRP